MKIQSCPDDPTLQSLLLGKLPADQAQALGEHLLQCDQCATRAETLDTADELIEDIRSPDFEPIDSEILTKIIERGKQLKSQIETVQSQETVAVDQREMQEEHPLKTAASPKFDSEQINFLKPPEAEDELGRLGGYRILKVMGVGGMGVVFLAEDPRLKRQVALKAMKPAVAASHDAKERFLLEARATAAIEHDNIVSIYQVGEDDGIPFIAMRYLQGESLQTKLSREEKLAPLEVARIGKQVALGLAEAHEKGLIHRDIKPDNIWLQQKTNRVKILDFGLARLHSEDTALTQTGMVLGTPKYMAPEQAKGEMVDHRCDLFSLGSVLYHLVSGQAPFTAKNVTGTLIKVSQADCIPIGELCPQLDAELAALITRLLSLDPDDRPAHGTEVVQALDAIETRLNLAVQSAALSEDSRKPPRNRRLTAFGGLAAIILLGVILYRIQTNNGTITVELADESIAAKLTTSGVIIEDGDRKWTLNIGDSEPLPAGDTYSARLPKDSGLMLTVTDDNGAELDTGKFQIRRNGKVLVKVTASVPSVAATETEARSSSTPSTSGKNWALEFDGKGDFVRINSIAFQNKARPVTIEATVRLRSYAHGTVARGIGPAVSPSLWISPVGTARCALHFKSSTLKPTGLPIATNQVCHLALSWDGQKPSMFINGVMDKSKVELENKGWAGGENVLFIGGFQSDYFLDGIIDEVRISNVGRYTKDFTPEKRFENDEHTLALYHFDEGQGDVLKDSSGNGHHGKIVGAKWVRVDEELKVMNDQSTEPNSLYDYERQVAEWVLNHQGSVFLTYLPFEAKSEEEFQSAIHQDRVFDFKTVRVGELQDLPDREFIVSGVSLRKRPLTEEDLRSLEGLHALKSLDLERSGVTDDTLSAIQEMLDLKRLLLSHTQITDKGFALLKHLPQLESISLGRTLVTADGMRVLSQLPNLRVINFSGRMLTEETVPVLKQVPRLREFFVYDLTDESLGRIAQMENLTQLEILNVDNSYTENALQQVANSLPNCKIYVHETFGPPPARVDNMLRSKVAYTWPQDQPTPAIAPFTAEEAKKHQEEWAKYLGVPVEKEITIGKDQEGKDVKLTMVLIPPGEFLMGSSDEERVSASEDAAEQGDSWAIHSLNAESPQHLARITKPFYLGKYELTQAQWQAVMDNNPSDFPTDASRPVERVSWHDSQAFIKQLNTEQHIAGLRFTLPSEAQWEYACRSGTLTAWSTGASRELLGRGGWFTANSKQITHPAGQLTPNNFGLHDMHGNVSEWCLDWFAPDYYSVAPANDPAALSVALDRSHRVHRGGWWQDYPYRCRSAFRYNDSIQFRDNRLGLRLAASIEVPSNRPSAGTLPEQATSPGSLNHGLVLDGKPEVSSISELRQNGAFGFPAAAARTLIDNGSLRLQSWNDAENLIVQAILWKDDDATLVMKEESNPSVKKSADQSMVVFDVDGNQKPTPEIDRKYFLEPHPNNPGLWYQVRGTAGYYVLQPDSGGHGAIRYLDVGENQKVRVDTYVIPLAEIGVAPGEKIGLGFVATSESPQLEVNSIGFSFNDAAKVYLLC